jgi:hypothetical protein
VYKLRRSPDIGYRVARVAFTTVAIAGISVIVVFLLTTMNLA